MAAIFQTMRTSTGIIIWLSCFATALQFRLHGAKSLTKEALHAGAVARATSPNQTCDEFVAQYLERVAVASLIEARRWRRAKRLPLVTHIDSGLIWKSILTKKIYKLERKRLKKIGLVDYEESDIDGDGEDPGNDEAPEVMLSMPDGTEKAENHSDWVDPTSISSVCALSLGTLQALAMNSNLLLTWQTHSVCADQSALHLSLMATAWLEKSCFESCLQTIKSHSHSHTSTCSGDTFNTDVFELILRDNDDCGRLPVDTLEQLADFSMQLRCLRFPPSSILWKPNDKSAGEPSQLGAQSLCKIPELDGRKKNADGVFLLAGDTCPGGTYCDCPKELIRSRKSVSDYRGSGRYFVREGVATAPSMAKQFTMGLLLQTFAANVLLPVATGGVVTIGGAFLATFTAPFFLITASLALAARTLRAYYKHDCVNTIGCWPEYAPVKVVLKNGLKSCKYPDSTRVGGSVLWFLPPPGLRLVRRISRTKKCVLTHCESEHMRKELVGYSQSGSRANLNNCQLMNYEDMTKDQGQHFVERLIANGVGAEYSLSLT